VSQFGLTDSQKGLLDFKGIKGIGADQIAQYKKIQGQLDALQKTHDMTDDVKKWRESIKGSIDEYDEAIKKLQEWRAAGQITQAELEKGFAKAQDKLQQAGPKPEQNRETRGQVDPAEARATHGRHAVRRHRPSHRVERFSSDRSVVAAMAYEALGIVGAEPGQAHRAYASRAAWVSVAPANRFRRVAG
jgi:hypothetical protein